MLHQGVMHRILTLTFKGHVKNLCETLSTTSIILWTCLWMSLFVCFYYYYYVYVYDRLCEEINNIKVVFSTILIHICYVFSYYDMPFIVECFEHLISLPNNY